MGDRSPLRPAFHILVVGVALALLGVAAPAFAAHDLGQDCYTCHNIKSGQVYQGSYSIWSGLSIGMSPYSRPITCEVCHTDYGDRFKATSASHHPVAVIAGATTNSSYDNGVQIRCRDCHNGNSVTTLTPNLIPDLAPTDYLSTAGNTATDGYPNHDVLFPNNQVAAGDNAHLLSMLLSGGQRTVNGSDVYNKIPSAAPATDYAFCLACHDGSANTARAVNVKQDYIDKGHYFKTTGGGINAGDRIPCSDCHASHNSSTNARLFEPDNTTWTGARPSGLTFASPYAPTALEVRAICTFCHDDTAPSGAGYIAGPYVRGVEPSVAPSTISDHITYTGTKTTAKCTNCHNPHKTPGGGPDCLTCHTSGGAAGTTYDYIDALFKGVGSDNGVAKPAASGALNWSQHGGFTGTASNFIYLSPFNSKTTNDCYKCHGDRHSNTYALIDADNTDTGASVFTPVNSLSAGTTTTANANAFCLTCHDGNGAAADVQIGGQVPPNVAANWSTAGHGRLASTTYGVTLNKGAELKCVKCHEVHGGNHSKLLPADNTATGSFAMPAGKPGMTFRNGALLASQIDFKDYSIPASGQGYGSTGDPGAQHGGTATVGLCDACHRQAGQSSGGTDNVTNKAHTHEGIVGDLNQTSPSQMTFTKDCLECHNTHGSPAATPNIAMVDNAVNGYVVSFTARTGANSFDPAEAGATPNVNSVCVVCHQNSTENASLNVAHNFRTSTVNPDHNEDADCRSCHSHGSTADAKKFGFPQAACNLCHGSSSDTTGMPAVGDGATYHVDANNIVGTRGGDNTVHKIHVNYLVTKKSYASSATCYACHQGGGGNESGGHPGNKTNTSFKTGPTPDNTAVIQVSLDNQYKLPGYQADPNLDNAYKGTPGTAAGAGAWKTCLTSCHRGASPSWAGKTQISADTVTFTLVDNNAPANASKGSTRNQMMEFTLASDNVVNGQATWSGITVVRTGDGADNTVSAVKIYADNTTSGTLGSLDAADPVIGSGTFSSGVAGIALTTAQTITTTAKTCFIGYDIAATAVDNVTVGTRLDSAGAFQLTSPDNMGSANLPASSTLSTVATPSGDIVTATGSGTAPASLAQSAPDDFLRFNLQVTTNQQDNTASFTGVSVTVTGTLPVTDIDNVVVYKDANADNTWQATDTVVGYAASPSASPVTVTFGAAETVTTSLSSSYFVVYKLKSTADWTKTVGASLASNGAVTVAGPDSVAATNFPISSTNISITDAPDQLTLTGTDSAPGTINQGSSDDFLRLVPSANQDNVVWTGLVVTKTGTAAVTDLDNVIVYKDANADNTWQATDTVVAYTASPSTSPVTVDFTTGPGGSQTITTAAQPSYFVVLSPKSTATSGNTLGAGIAADADIQIQGTTDTRVRAGVTASTNATIQVPADIVTATGSGTAPASLAQSAPDDFLRFNLQVTTNQQDNTASFTGVSVTVTGTLPVTDIDNVVVYKDANADNTWQATDTVVGYAASPSASPVTVTFGAAETVTTSLSSSYFVVYKLKSTADWTKTVGASLASNGAVTVAGPDSVASTNFPISSTNISITDVPDQLTLTGTDSAPGNITAGTDNAFLRLAPSVNQDNVAWTGLTVTYTGTTVNDIDNVMVYRDFNSNNTYEAGTDTLIGWGTPAATTTVTFGTPETITTAAQPAYFVVVHVKASATASNTVSVRIADNNAIARQGTIDTTVLSPTPTNSGNATIQAALQAIVRDGKFPAGAIGTTWTATTATEDTTATATADGTNSARLTTSKGSGQTFSGNVEQTLSSPIPNGQTGITAGLKFQKNYGAAFPAASQTVQIVFVDSGGTNTQVVAQNTAVYQASGWLSLSATNITSNFAVAKVRIEMSTTTGGNKNATSDIWADEVYVTYDSYPQFAPPRETGGGTAIACNSCHQFGPIDNTIASTGGFYDAVNYQYWISQAGSHPKHAVAAIAGNDPVASNATDTCTMCHLAGTDTFSSTHSDGPVDIRSGSIGTRTAGPAYADDGTYDNATRTCSNVYCHAGRPTPQATGKSWGYGSSACGVCHAVTPPFGKHSIHNNGNANTTPSNASTAGNYDFSCYYCHPSGAAHVNFPVSAVQAAEVSFSGTLGAQTLSGTYTPGGATAGWDNVTNQGLSWTNGSCAIYCHTNGQGGAALVTPTWNYSGFPTATCVGCHDTGGPTTTLSTRHQKHTDNTAATGYNLTCDQCHTLTVAAGSKTTLNATTGRVNHVDGALTVSFSSTLRGIALSIGGSYTQGVDNCANTYCHSDGSSIKNGGTIQTNSITWGTAGPLACNSCHGVGGPASGAPNYTTSGSRRNSHSNHSAFGCQTCHSQTTSDGTTITNGANHVNGSYNVSGTGFTYAYDSVNGSTCAFTAGCHGTTTVRWGTPLTGYCFACHQGAEGTNKPQGASDNNANPVDNTQYFQSGHGRTGTNYPVSGNAPAGKWDSGTGAGCYTTDTPNGCHVTGAAHIPASATDPYRLGATYADNTTALCLTCHGAAGPAATRNMQEHSKTITGSTKTWPNNYDWKCVDCHDPHGDGTDAANRLEMIRIAINNPSGTDNANVGSNSKGSPMRAPGWTNIAFTSTAGFAAGAYAIPGTTTYGICEGCHRQTVTYGLNLDNASTHATRTGNCITCHPHAQGFKGACNTCHGDINGTVRGDGSFYPPEGPTAVRTGKTYTWAETAGTGTTRGDHAMHAGVYGKDCAQCHVSGYGADAAHNNNKTDATMSAIATYGTWSAGALAGYQSVTDDYCGNISCHSPYSAENSGNTYKSATPFTSGPQAYRRYWIDNVTGGWDCYTCHAYDGRTATTRPTTGVKTDNTMSTGSHLFHVDNTQMACTNCHASGSYTTSHKNGFVDWSFAGSPDPYADTEAYSVASGTRTPTDNTAGRLYGSCSNLYCHSTVQTSPPGGAVTHSNPTWGTASTGNCGTCHAGNGITDNVASLMSTGTHSTHDNTTGYNIGCTVCHTGAGTMTSQHADGRVQVPLGNSSWRSFTLTGTSTIYDNTTGAPTTDDIYAVVGADASYGKCSSIPCHGNGQGGAPLVTPAVWGATDTTCTYCHDTRGAATTLSTRHQKHTDNTAGTGYNFSCDECHTLTVANDSWTTLNATTGYANHVDGNLTVSFSTTLRTTAVAISGSYTQGVDNCANTYCHSDGSSIKNGGTIQANSITWGTAGPLACNSCHGYPPNYTSAANRANSHTAHSSYGCQVCHSRTTTTGNTITAADNHVNGSYNVVQSGTNVFVYTYNAAGSTCAFTSGCHGASTVTWGGTLAGGCSACHGGTSDTNNFGYNDGTLAIIQMTGGWDTTGHGRTTAFPSTASGNPAPNEGTRFGSAGTPNCTNFCHDSGQPHTDNNAGSNYFRLATGTGATGRAAITPSTANNVCLQCHSTGGAYAAQATRDVVTAHYGSKHDNTTKNAGNFCWDCHEPHGDANDYMMQAAVATRTDMSTSPGGIGIPLTTSAVSFLKPGGSNASAYDWGDYAGTVSGDTNRLCRVCHDSTVNHFNTTTWDSAHNPGTRCTSCHGDTYKHDINFRGIGTCVGCHSGAQGSSPARRVVTGASGDFSKATHHVTNYVDNTTDGAVQNVDCSKCHWEGYLTGDTILAGRTPAKQGDTNPAFHWTDDANNATAKYVQLRVWSTASAPIAYSNTAGTGSGIEWRNGTANNPVTEAINLNRHCLGCHSSTIGAGTPFSDSRSPRVRAWDGLDIGTKYLRNGAANTVKTHQYSNTTYNVVPPPNKALSPHYDLQNNQRGVATTGAWATDDAAGVSNTATGSVACFDCHNSHGSNVTGTATLPLVSYANNATLNAGLTNANVGGLFKTTTTGESGYTTAYSPVENATWNWGAGSAACFDCHVGSTAGGAPPKTYVDFGRTATQLVAGYYDPVDWGGTVAAGQGVWDNRRWSGSFAYKANNIVVSHFKNDSAIRALQTTPTTQLNGMCSRCHDPHGVTTNTTMVSNANYGTPALKGTWMTSPYFEDRPGERYNSTVSWNMNAKTVININNNVYNGTSLKGRGGPRMITYRDFNRPSVVGGGYGTTGGGTGNDGFFIDENTFGLVITSAFTWDLFGVANLNTNNGWQNLWYGGYRNPVPTIAINRITETNAQFAGLCEKCHTPASLVNTASKAANIITHAHRTVKGWDALPGGPAAADIFRSASINNTTNNGAFSQRMLGSWFFNNMAANFSDYRFVEDPGEPWSGFPFHWGVNLNRTAGQFVTGYVQTNYHQFPCSKCHTPHTSRLPRLLKTNCLDTGTVRGVNGGASNWGTTGSWVQRHSTNATNQYINRFRTTSNATFAWTPARAVRCHQDAYQINGTAANDSRWNDITPW